MADCLNCGYGPLPVRVGKGGKWKFCSEKCRARHWYLRVNSRPAKPCKGCGVEIQAGSHANRDYCSRLCSQKDRYNANHLIRYRTDEKYRDMFQRNGHNRRARLRSVRCVNFSPSEILNRDGWKCRICGKDTPKELRGKKVSNAPTLDHIVPIALGGEHTPSNTQCACLGCNCSKGGRAKLL